MKPRFARRSTASSSRSSSRTAPKSRPASSSIRSTTPPTSPRSESAEASLAQANANLVKARADAKRSSELVKINAVSTVRRRRSGRAQVRRRQQRPPRPVATAKGQRYTKVLSPISGRISRSEFTEGALMAAYQATPLTRVQQLDPIYVDVTQKADDLMRIRRDIASGVLKSGDNRPRPAHLDDAPVYPHEGELAFTDVCVHRGMVNVRAVFPNPDKVLLPGLYVRANLVEGVRPDSIVIPMQCVMRDAKGNASVWVIDAENKIATRKDPRPRSILWEGCVRPSPASRPGTASSSRVSSAPAPAPPFRPRRPTPPRCSTRRASPLPDTDWAEKTCSHFFIRRPSSGDRHRDHARGRSLHPQAADQPVPADRASAGKHLRHLSGRLRRDDRKHRHADHRAEPHRS